MVRSNAISVLLAILLIVCWQPAVAKVFKSALPGYKFNFPADFAAHEDYKTEWWYYTGHLRSDDGAEFGYELTFFRIGMDVPHGVADSPWTMKNVYMAHFAVSDLSGKRFFHQQRMNRAGLGVAGADTASYHVWNQNWSARQVGGAAVALSKPSKADEASLAFSKGERIGDADASKSKSFLTDEAYRLTASSPEYSISLKLLSMKPPVVHGLNGVSQKAACKGCASHYYSLTRLDTDGEITARGRRLHVQGLSWMDHEFGSNQLTADQVGWDWFSIQLDDDRELMLYVMRQKDKSIDPYSSGTLIASDGAFRHLSADDYSIQPTGTWHSEASGGDYSMGWQVSVPEQKLMLTISPAMTNQELTKQGTNDVTYWEGACKVSGSSNGLPVHGQSYVEMTGYADAFNKRI